MKKNIIANWMSLHHSVVTFYVERVEVCDMIGQRKLTLFIQKLIICVDKMHMDPGWCFVLCWCSVDKFIALTKDFSFLRFYFKHEYVKQNIVIFCDTKGNNAVQIAVEIKRSSFIFDLLSNYYYLCYLGNTDILF